MKYSLGDLFYKVNALYSMLNKHLHELARNLSFRLVRNKPHEFTNVQ